MICIVQVHWAIAFRLCFCDLHVRVCTFAVEKEHVVLFIAYILCSGLCSVLCMLGIYCTDG
jgi:hypothetical protein